MNLNLKFLKNSLDLSGLGGNSDYGLIWKWPCDYL